MPDRGFLHSSTSGAIDMTSLQTRLCDLLGIRHAILLAAMAGAPSTPELAGAVSRAGGLGVLGVSGMSVDAVFEATQAALACAGGGPIGVNAQLGPATPPTGDRGRIVAVLAPLRTELGLAPEPPEPPVASATSGPLDLIAAALSAGASVVTTFEDPLPAIGMVRAAGVPLLSMVTTPAEAVLAVAAGADGVIAQGSEAGGHRSAFLGGSVPSFVPEVGSLALIPQVVDAVGTSVPVVASGGIMDGRGIAAALALGASGVSLGTRFLVAVESGVPECYRLALARCPASGTVVTAAVTGRPARFLRNRIVATLMEAEAGTLGWGAQSALIADLRRAAAEQGRTDLLPMLAGQGAGLAGPPAPAAEIVRRLVIETAETR